jgi:hypothetical protein
MVNHIPNLFNEPYSKKKNLNELARNIKSIAKMAKYEQTYSLERVTKKS